MRLLVLVQLVLLVTVACGPPPCAPVPVTRPRAEAVLPWAAGGNAVAAVDFGGKRLDAVLDTGFPRSAVALTQAGGLDLGRVRVGLAGAEAGPLEVGLLLNPALELGAVVGGEVLHQLPLAFDARARTVTVRPSFTGGFPGAAPLDVWVTGRCHEDRAEAGPEGPHALLVRAMLDGQALTLVLDTGADVTFVRTAVVEALDPRPTLSGLRVATGFSGLFSATATRARALTIEGASSPNSLLLTGPEVDAELDRLLGRYGGRRCAGGSGCPERLDGFLGWSFLREFAVDLSSGSAPTGSRRLGLSRFESQDHWRREFIGVGIYTSPSAEPEGLRIGGFLPASPAREAGLREGDVLLTVDGVPMARAPSPYAAPGVTVTLEVARGGERLSVPVQVRDLLPDPP